MLMSPRTEFRDTRAEVQIVRIEESNLVLLCVVYPQSTEILDSKCKSEDEALLMVDLACLKI
jgi:hypothetical protein